MARAARMIIGKASDKDGLEAPDSDDEGGPITVTEALDSLALGRFHAFHLMRMILFWAILSMTQECTPYLFPGLRRSLNADEQSIASFAAAFPLGCVLGTVAAAFLLDKLGRRGTVVIISPLGVLLGLVSMAASSMEVLLVLRVLQSLVFAIIITALSTWYIEFLPTANRGMLMASYSVGWPIGRAVVILTASVAQSNWTSFMAASAAGFALLFLLIFFAQESPRFLVACGRQQEANEVLSRLHEANRQAAWRPSSQLCLNGKDTRPSSRCSTWTQLLERGSRELLLFALALFGVLASTTVLLDTWGPGIYHKLLAPESQELPTQTLMLFNIGDLTGVAISIVVIDRIGRLGSFAIGFFVQGTLLALVTCLDTRDSTLLAVAVLFGTLASACRCFGWESAQMWTLEAFPTELRAIAFSTSTAIMRFLSILSLKVSAQYINHLSAATSLQLLAATLIAGGFLSTGLLPKETAKEPMSEGAVETVKHY